MDKFDLYGKLAIPKKHDFEYEVPALYRIAAGKGGVFVNPAFTEPFGLTLIEAAATGLPIVTTDDGGPRDIIDNCNNGLLVDVNDCQLLANSIKKVLIEQERWKNYSNNGVEGVRKHYAWDTHCDNYLMQINVLPVSKQKHLEVSKQPSRIGKRLIALKKIFVTDIDNTLLGDEIALQSLHNMLSDQRDVVGFGVATGRTIDSAIEVLKKHKIPSPDLIISSVGSEIYYGAEHLQDNGWRTHISCHWQRDKIVEVLSRFKFLVKQEEETQRDFKVSYYMQESPRNLARIHQALSENRLRYNLIYSDGHFLDILPERASKGKAIRYLCYKWNILLDRVLVAGDSGNDAEMLRGSMLGVVVGNHSEDLEKLRGLQRIYFSPLPYAAGILDGLYHYHFLNGAEWNGVQIKTVIEQTNPHFVTVD
jgi:sucrose-phosphate synthase